MKQHPVFERLERMLKRRSKLQDGWHVLELTDGISMKCDGKTLYVYDELLTYKLKDTGECLIRIKSEDYRPESLTALENKFMHLIKDREGLKK